MLSRVFDVILRYVTGPLVGERIVCLCLGKLQKPIMRMQEGLDIKRKEKEYGSCH